MLGLFPYEEFEDESGIFGPFFSTCLVQLYIAGLTLESW